MIPRLLKFHILLLALALIMTSSVTWAQTIQGALGKGSLVFQANDTAPCSASGLRFSGLPIHTQTDLVLALEQKKKVGKMTLCENLTLSSWPFTQEFKGHFDGAGHTLDFSNANLGSTGLFGHITKGAIIENLNITNISMASDATEGDHGIMALTNSGTIRNVEINNAQLEMGQLVFNGANAPAAGILVGFNNRGLVQNVRVLNSLLNGQGGQSDIGGLIGRSTAGKIRNIHLIDTSVLGEVGVGGLIGLSQMDSLKNASFSSTLNGPGIEVNGRTVVGGIAGHMVSSHFDTVRVFGSVNIQIPHRRISGRAMGGIVGEVSIEDDIGSSIFRAGVTRNVNVNPHEPNETPFGNQIGGLVGWVFPSFGFNGGQLHISQSYNFGSVQGRSDIGGLAGETQETRISNSYSYAEIIALEGQGGGAVGSPRRNRSFSMQNVLSFGATLSVLQETDTMENASSSGTSGLFGEITLPNENMEITQSYFNSDQNPIFLEVEQSFARTTRQLQNSSTYDAFDLMVTPEGQTNPLYIWSLPAGKNSFPILSWDSFENQQP